MKLILVRHGETEANAKSLVQGGGSDYPLTEKGIEQAKKVSEFLKDEKIDLAYSSDLKRAVSTANEILKHHKVELIKTKELREVHAGDLEGKKTQAGEKVFSATFKAKGGESLLEARERLSKFYDSIKEDKNILLVGHGASFGALLLYIFNKEVTWEEYNACRPPVAGITILEIKGDKIKKVLWNKQL